jgi:hypothetical protein
MGHPVRTTVGFPRFSLTYTLAGHAALLTPTRQMLGLPLERYEPEYRRRLDAAGIDAILTELGEIAARHPAGRPLVLLCFDRLDKPGSWCHRTMAAQWLAERTGHVVPELGAVAKPVSQESLFD